jgi:ribosome biogenesis GTPase
MWLILKVLPNLGQYICVFHSDKPLEGIPCRINVFKQIRKLSPIYFSTTISEMSLEDLGYNAKLEEYRISHGLASLLAGRVIAEHKERYIVKTDEREFDCELLGNLRFAAESRYDLPAVGDWVAIREYDDGKALIHAIFPRRSIIERLSVGKKGEKQIIATNIDTAFIVQAVDRDFNINRLERYLTICHQSHVEPIIVLTKTDMIDKKTLSEMAGAIRDRLKNIPVLGISNVSLEGIETLKEIIEKRKTYCLLGSSGVGKSTLVNTLSGEDIMKTRSISEFSGRGKHVTTHRELMLLDSGGILIDNPGMREVGIADAGSGLAVTFDVIERLSENCRFKDCTHTSETGCAVLEALETGDLEADLYENYLRMLREKDHFESTVAEKRKKEKAQALVIKHYKKGKYKDR